MAERQNAAKVMTGCIVPSQWDADLYVLLASSTVESAERELIGVAGAPYRISDPLAKIMNYYAAIVIDTRRSFSLLTEMVGFAVGDRQNQRDPGRLAYSKLEGRWERRDQDGQPHSRACATTGRTAQSRGTWQVNLRRDSGQRSCFLRA